MKTTVTSYLGNIPNIVVSSLKVGTATVLIMKDGSQIIINPNENFRFGKPLVPAKPVKEEIYTTPPYNVTK